MSNVTGSGPFLTEADSQPVKSDFANRNGLHQNDEDDDTLSQLHSFFEQGSPSQTEALQPLLQAADTEEPETSLHRKNTRKGSNTTSSVTGRAAFLMAATHPDTTDSTVGIATEGAGSLSHLQSLFQHRPASQHREQEQPLSSQQYRSEEPDTALHPKDTRNETHTMSSVTERTALLSPSSIFKNNANSGDESLFVTVRTSTLSGPSSLSDLFQRPASQQRPQMERGGRKFTVALPNAGGEQNTNGIYQVQEKPTQKETPTRKKKKKTTRNMEQICKEAAKEASTPSTYIGGLMFVLYHLVFCLASGSAIQRHGAKNSMLGPMTKMGALGIMFAAPVYLHNIGNGIPSMYPTCDLFLAPIFAAIAKIIDRDLAELTHLTDEEGDEIFLATFGFLTFVGMGLAGCLLILAGVFKLANLGAFLPFPVLCGFFSAVAFRTWNLGFVVDTSGKSFRDVISSGDTDLMLYALMHHIPGVIVAIVMKYLGPKHPFSVLLVLFATIAAVYVVMFVTGTTLDEARALGWFWYHEDMVYEEASNGLANWLPPAPFGAISGMLMGKIHWASVWNGLPPACALSFLYLIRCALHSAAVLKNVANLTRSVKTVGAAAEAGNVTPRKKSRMEMFSEIVDIDEIINLGTSEPSRRISTTMELERAKPTTWTLQGVLIQYGIAQVVSAVVGGFAIVPSVATSHAMFALRAERVGPQLLSVILISGFYLTDFRLIAFVPKMAFSCLLSLAFIDNTLTWFIRSYFKTKSKQEWLAVPLIVLFAFAMGLLQAVFLGIAISTFLFVGAFFRSGVVKFAASGLTIRSTIERPPSHAQWLDEHGDLIQVVICQNYLFFGNASSIFSYINSMFEDNTENDLEVDLPPIPQFVILDMVLVTGMDTSTVSIVSDILNLCQRHGCKLFLSGMSPELRSVLAHAGVKPLGGERSERKLRFFTTLDTAIGKAEDLLLEFQFEEKPPSTRNLFPLGEESGFQLALCRVDEQHGTCFAQDLADLEEYMVPIELVPGESLYDSASRPERGLFFIEKGVMKIERDACLTTNTRSLSSLSSFGRVRGNIGNCGSISDLRHRSGTIGRDYAELKSTNMQRQQQSFRLARVGAGWVVGAVEAVSGLEKAGVHFAVTACRLHYISYCRMELLEAEHPILMLRLYKLLSHVMAKQQELTIGQLGTLHAIMSSPAQTKPIGRRATLAFRQLH